MLGDYNGNHVVDAADYTRVAERDVNRRRRLLNDASPGSVSMADYTYWKTHFGATSGSGGALGGARGRERVVA